MSNKVYIAVSLDGYIADTNGEINWLSMIPMTEELQSEFTNFMDGVDCLVMGRNTFETVKSFGEWPYDKKVFVASSSMKMIPNGYEEKIELLNASALEIVKSLNEKGYKNLYIDGGKTIQNFLKEGLIDELIISTIPIVLGGGRALFAEIPSPATFKLVGSKIISKLIVQTHYQKV